MRLLLGNQLGLTQDGNSRILSDGFIGKMARRIPPYLFKEYTDIWFRDFYSSLRALENQS